MSKYTFRLLWNKATNEVRAVELADKTIIFFNKDTNGLRIGFPRNKFKPLLQKKMREKGKYFEFEFTEQEVYAFKDLVTANYNKNVSRTLNKRSK